MSNLFCTEGTVVTVYPTPDSMRSKVDEYFEMCFARVWSKKYNREVEECVRVPTYSGLARYLGFGSRAQLLNYVNSKDEAFADVVKEALLRIEDFLEGKLVFSKAPNGIMFSLKNNAGWEDKTKRELAGANGQPLVFGWDNGASDVIDASTVNPPLPENNNKGVLPAPPIQIESTCEEE